MSVNVEGINWDAKEGTFKYTYYLRCECLRDQGVMCGGDPIGHACYNVARQEWQMSVRGQSYPFLICDECAKLADEKSDRVTFPAMPLGIEGQKAMINRTIANMLKVKKGGVPDEGPAQKPPSQEV